MSPAEVESILRLIGADKIKRASSGDFMHLRCPFAPYKNEHANKVDRKPSAWVSYGAWPMFGCWTCTTEAMNLVKALEQLNDFAGGRFTTAVDRARTLTGKTTGQRRSYSVYSPTNYTDDYLTKYDRPNDLPFDFLASKGITKTATIKDFRVGVDARQGLVLFPIINRQQLIVGAQARQFVNQTDTGPKYFSFYPKTSKSQHLFGEHLLALTRQETASGYINWEFTGKAVIVFEGPLDCMHAYDVGLRNVVAIMGAKLSEEQMTMLVDLVKAPGETDSEKTIYFILDPDAAGRSGMSAAVQQLFVDMNPNINVQAFVTPKDPKQMTRQEFVQLLTQEKTLWQKRPIKHLLRELLKRR